MERVQTATEPALEHLVADVEDRELPQRVAEVLRVERPADRLPLGGKPLEMGLPLEELGRGLERHALGVETDRNEEAAVA